MTIEEILATFEAPIENGINLPYVLFARPEIEARSGKLTGSYRGACFEITGPIKAGSLIDHYAQKPGWKIVKYFLPERADYMPIRQKLDLLTGISDSRVKELEGEKEDLMRRLREAESRKAKA